VHVVRQIRCLLDDVRVAKSARDLGSREQLLSAAVNLRALSFDGLDLMSLRLPAQLWLDRCSFVGADLRQSTLAGAHFKMCDFSKADLRGASLRGTRFGGCDFSGADLRGADLHGTSFGSVNTGDQSGRSLLTAIRVDEGQLDGAIIEPGTYLPDSVG
jgi:uncharacterized protein YjbI with pentapeptide repeats